MSFDRTEEYKMPIYEVVFIIFCCWYYILPSASVSINFMTMIFIIGAYLLYVIHGMPKYYAKEIGKGLLCALFIAACYYFLTSTSTISTSASNYQLKRYLSKFSQVLFAFFPQLLLFRLLERGSFKQKKTICYITGAILVYTISTTWQELLINANATRSWSGFTELASSNVGSYAFVYAVSALVPVLLILLDYARQLWQRISVIVLIILIFSFLLVAQYTLSIMIATISIVVYFYINAKNGSMRILFILAIPFVYMLLPTVFYFVSSHVVSEQIATRTKEMADALTGNSLEYNMNGRLTLYGMSIQAFLKSPIFGNRSLGFDGHSTFLSILADVGLLGGIPYYFLYFSSNNRVKRMLGEKSLQNKFLPVFVSLMLMGLTNPIQDTLPLYWVVWLLAPLLIDILENQKISKM